MLKQVLKQKKSPAKPTQRNDIRNGNVSTRFRNTSRYLSSFPYVTPTYVKFAIGASR